MDSKLRRMAILSSMAVILLVSALVLYLNKEEGKPGDGTSPGSGVSQEETQGSGGAEPLNP